MATELFHAMEASEEAEAMAVLGELEEPVEVVKTQQLSKKRSLEDMQQDTEPDASEPHQAPSPEPEAKRTKTDQTDKKEGMDDAENDKSAEEGELEEDDEVSETSDCESEETHSKESEGAPTVAVDFNKGLDAGSKRKTRLTSAVADGAAQIGWNQGITSQIRTSLRGTALPAPALAKTMSQEATRETQPKSSTELVPSPASRLTAPATNEPPKNANQGRAERRREKQAQAVLEIQKAQDELKKPFEYSPGLLFLLPGKKNILSPKGNNIGTGVWKPRFKSWCQSFIRHNIDRKDQLNADIAVAALQEYIATCAHWPKKKHREVATAEARKPQTKNDMAVNLATILKNDDYLGMRAGTGAADSPMIIDDDEDEDDVDGQDIAPPSGTITPANAQSAVPNAFHPDQREGVLQLLPGTNEEPQDAFDNVMAESGRPGPVVLSEEADLAQQRKYFPGLAESECICVYCATPGHISSACPRTACKFCEEDGHFSWNCPTRERCTKCRQLGHGKERCTEKLIRLDDEGVECATCGSSTHNEDDCEALWRSYKPRKGMIKKVNVLPAFCGRCGSEGHYSSDCAFRGDDRRSQTWSLKNRDLYFDESAAEGPISNFFSIPKPLQLRTKGASARQNHIFYADSDGSEEGEFLGQKVKPRAPPGSIQMSTNIQLANFGEQQPQSKQNGRGQQKEAWSAQPPLPPGPPPAGPPPRGSYSRMSKTLNNQSRPPPPNNGMGRGGLPPKPPASQHGYHNVAPPPNRRGPKSKKPRTKQLGNASTVPSHQPNGGGPAGRRRGKNRRGGKQG